jgi:hypothetical protein
MVVEIDLRIALTADQRKRLEPICDRLATRNLAMLPSRFTQGYGYVDAIGLAVSGLKSSQTEVQAILDPVQWRHWLDVCDSITRERGSVPNPTPARGVEKRALPAEPEEYEAILANYLDKETQTVRQRALASSLLWAEDAGRASNLPAEKIELLKTAVRGAVEESTSNWKSDAEEAVRSFVQDTPVRFVRARLENLERNGFLQTLSPPPETQAIWTEALKANLDAQQLAAAEKSKSDRATFREEAIAAFVAAMFDETRRHLTAAQQSALTVAAARMLKEYRPDIRRYSSGWYLRTYSMFVPIAGIPETELKSILGPECFDRWAHSPQFANVMSWWMNIKQIHDNRVKAAAPAKK